MFVCLFFVLFFWEDVFVRFLFFMVFWVFFSWGRRGCIRCMPLRFIFFPFCLDYNKGEIDAVIKRGQDLLKSLRKHTDIVSWSRRRLRWFGVAHSYMGSALADKGEHDKAKSHHQADFRIGEAL